MTNFEITGNVRYHFIQAAVLLHVLDPVRGEPTAYGLDQDPHEIESPRERLLKRKFLDSFALVCSTRKGGDNVSASCIEEGGPEGTILRIASNAGISEEILGKLRGILSALGEIASQVREPVSGEQTILVRIIELDIIKIRDYLKDIRNGNGFSQKPLSTVESILVKNGSFSAPDIQKFLEWVEYSHNIKDLPLDCEPTVLVSYIRWAQIAKKNYVEFLKVAFKNTGDTLPRWVRTIFKLGRYGVAARALVQLAFELPALVNPMVVQPVEAPLKTKFTVLEEEMPLICVLKRVVGEKATELVPKFAQIWNTEDAESHFRRACSVDLVAHAEMQLINFYDHNPQCRPLFRFIGVSKKSCYLCQLFLANHPDSFGVSSCHQKLYKSWIPPPATDSKVYRKRKDIIKKLSKVMESNAKQDLEHRLGTTRRPVPADSTAGVSLSGLTDLFPERALYQAPVETHIETGMNSDSIMEAEPWEFPRPIRPDSSTPTNLDSDSVPSRNMEIPQSTDPSSGTDLWKINLATVFHIVRSSDARKQDIIRISDILDHTSNCASWASLVQIMQTDDGFGLAFKEGRDYLLVNDQIRVANERQFLACIQYLQNSEILNVNAVVFAATEPPTRQ